VKLCRLDPDRFGLVEGDTVFDVTHVVASKQDGLLAGSVDAAIRALPALRSLPPDSLRACKAVPLRDARLLSPVRSPGKIVAAPVNYMAHVNEMPGTAAAGAAKERDIGKAGLFLKANSSLAGPSQPLAIRFPDRRTDHEVELVVVIGRQATDVARRDALTYVAGYCLGLDITLRGSEDRSFRKSIDGYSVVGPWLATADEIADPNDIELRLSVNGELRQRASTADMVFDVPRLIEFASSFYTLHPGDLIFTGTPQGVGPLRPGDVVEASGDGLGSMHVRVVAHSRADLA